jgi:hypothetical protein
MNGYETYLTNINNKQQLKIIEEKKTEIKQLASTLRAKQGDGKGPVKKRKSTLRSRRRRRHRKSSRRRRRHRKSSRRRRHRKY